MELKLNFKEFQNEISSKGIEFLVHFTPTINLLSIFEQGKILSRAILEEFDIEQTDIFDYIEFTDEIRFDDKNFINLSIQHPNSYLFSRFRQKTSIHSHIHWCVLKIDPKYIYQRDTLFSITNAANSHNRRNIGVTGDLRKFKMMFEDNIQVITSYSSRVIRRGSLPSMYPTDEQAEVLVKNVIPISDILEICFLDDEELSSCKAALSNNYTDNFKVESSIFSNLRE